MASVQTLLTQFAGNTSLHGASQIIRAKRHVTKLVWVTIFIGATVMFAIQLTQLFIKYYKHEKRNVVEMRELDNNSLPLITVCIPQIFKAATLNKLYELYRHNKTKRDEIISNTDNEFIHSFSSFYDNVMTKLYSKDLSHLFDPSQWSSQKFLRNLLFNFNWPAFKDELISAEDVLFLPGEHFEVIFSHFQDGLFLFDYDAQCFTLKFRLKQIKVYFVLISEYHLMPKKSAKSSISPIIAELLKGYLGNFGASIYVHSQGNQHNSFNNRHDVQPNQHMSFFVDIRKTERLDVPYGNCTRSYALDHHPNAIYEQFTCEVWGHINSVIKRCGCLPAVVKKGFSTSNPHLENVPVCDADLIASKLLTSKNVSTQHLIYAIKQYRSMESCFKTDYDYASTKHKHCCPEECIDYTYNVDKSWLYMNEEERDSSYLHAQYYINYLIKQNYKKRLAYLRFNKEHICGKDYTRPNILCHAGIPIESVTKTLSTIIVQLQPQIMVNKEYPDYTLLQLMSDIGGQLGLWIGMSIITIFELLNLFAKLLHALFKCKLKQNKLDKRNHKNTVKYISPNQSAKIDSIEL